MFIIDNCEQVDITPDEAERLLDAGLIYRPEEGEIDGNPNYFSTPWDVSLADVDAFLGRARATHQTE